MSKTYRSDALAAIHETASDLHDAGVMDKRTLPGLDQLCLTRRSTSGRCGRASALARRCSRAICQAVFARYLNVTTGLISQCERGEKRPAGASLKLLNLVDRRGLAAIA